MTALVAGTIPGDSMFFSNILRTTDSTDVPRSCVALRSGKTGLTEAGQRLTLKNLSIDYDPLPFTQGVFIDADNEAGTGDLSDQIDLKIEAKRITNED